MALNSTDLLLNRILASDGQAVVILYDEYDLAAIHADKHSFYPFTHVVFVTVNRYYDVRAI